MKTLHEIVIAAEGRKRSATAQIHRFTTLATVVCALLTAAATPATAKMQDTALHILVLEGEESVNIIEQGTAIPTLVEVRDRNDLPVSGASVVFLLGDGGYRRAERRPAAGIRDDQRARTGGGKRQPDNERRRAADGQRDVRGADGSRHDRTDELRDGRGSRRGRHRNDRQRGRQRCRRSWRRRGRRAEYRRTGRDRRRSSRRSSRGRSSSQRRRRRNIRQGRADPGRRRRPDAE